MAKIDQRGMLKEALFSYRSTKDGKVFLYWKGKQVKILKANDAAAFLAQADGLDEYQSQLLMARVTGNFKRGNER